MSNILAIHSSLSGARSVSGRLVDETIAALRQAEPNSRVVVRDLGAAPVPHLDGDAISGIRG